jgi:type I restriction enzyme M protein
MTTKELIERIFKDPQTKYSLTEFETLGKPIHDILTIYPKVVTSGRDAGKTKYFLKSLAKFESGREEVQVSAEDGKSNPEEIVRQLWIYKLINQYDYRPDQIVLEKKVYFGGTVYDKPCDIVVYRDNTLQTPKIIFEIKKPKRKDGIEQLKSYLNAEGSPSLRAYRIFEPRSLFTELAPGLGRELISMR